MTDEEIIHTLEPYVTTAKQWQEELSGEREKFYRYYRAEPYGNEREGWAQTVSPTIYDVVEWIKPGLYEIFTGDFFDFKPENGDAEAATRLKKYVRHKIFTEQEGEEVIEDWIHEALTTHYGILKVTHKDEYSRAKRDFERLEEQEFMQLQSLDEVEVTDYEEVQDASGMYRWYENITVSYKEPEYVGPSIEVIPAREFYATPGYAKVGDCPMVAHVVRRPLDYIKRREAQGIYNKGSFDKVKNKLADTWAETEVQGEVATFFTSDNVSQPDAMLSTTSNDEATEGNNEVSVWECYCKLDIDGDGFLEPAIVTICEDVVLMGPVENPYRSPPFVLGTIHKEPGKMIGRPEADILDPWQRVLTNLLRSVQDSAILSANRGFLTTDRQTQQALSKWAPGQTAHVQNLNSVQEIDFGAPNQYVFKAYELMSAERDKLSGINEAFMGLDQNALNKTASGMGMKLTASQQKQKMYARRLARAIREMLGRVLDCIRLYPPEDDMRVVGQDIDLQEYDIEGRYSVDIDVGVGQQEKMQKAQILDSVIQFQLQAGMQMGISTPEHVLKAQEDRLDYLDMTTAGYFKTVEELQREQQQQAAMAQRGGPGAGGPPNPGAPAPPGGMQGPMGQPPGRPGQPGPPIPQQGSGVQGQARSPQRPDPGAGGNGVPG